jgi:hypothetical protein
MRAACSPAWISTRPTRDATSFPPARPGRRPWPAGTGLFFLMLALPFVLPAETGAETHADPDALHEVFGREQAASGSSLYPPDRRLAAILPLGRFAAASG